MSQNLKLTLAYDGTDFHGWQVQPDLPSIQGTLAEAIARVTDERVLPQGAGRTDAGVHALGQVASCAIESSIPARNFRIALNNLLPATIRVLDIQAAPPEFHARHSALGKIYQYRIYRGEICPPQLARYVCHHPYPLDENAMANAASIVIGEHDFTSFAAADPERNGAEEKTSNLRSISHSQFARQGNELLYTVEGNGFLRHMVRNLVGSFLLAGKGALTEKDLLRILDAKNRALAGPTALAQGLWLVCAKYE